MDPIRSSSRRRLALLATVLLPLATAGAQSQDPDPGTAAASTRGAVAAPQARVSEHVIVISLDGLRPDAIGRFGARHIRRLMAEGSYTLHATTIMPSRTLPSHTSMLTGAEPETHGITWNSEEVEEHGHVATPTIFALAKAAGLHTAAFFSKSKFQHLAVPGTLDYVQAPDGWPGKWLADRTMSDVKRYLEHERPNLLFVHLAEPDLLGHVFGWMSPTYGAGVRKVDQEVGKLLVAADRAFGAGNYTVLLTADHGGHGRDHGSADPRDVTIPWVAWGKGIEAGVVLEPGVRTMDTAATALWLLGVPPSAVSVGHAVTAALVPAASALVDSGRADSAAAEVLASPGG